MLLELTKFDPIRFCVVFFFVVVLGFLSFFPCFWKNFNDLTFIAFLGRQQFISTTCVKKIDYDHDDEISLV